MRTIKMYDTASTEGVKSIPPNAQAVAGYVDGHYQTFPLLVKQFYPRAHCVSIGVEIGHLAEWTDVEPGNPINTPALVRDDFERRKAHGVWKPGYYADRSDMETIVIPGLSGIPRNEYRLWVANPDRDGVMTKAERETYEAVQDFFDGPYDISLVNVDTFFPKGQAPKRKKPNLRQIGKKVHPSIPTGGASVGLAAILAKAGVHLTPAEWTLLGASLAALAAAANAKAKK